MPVRIYDLAKKLGLESKEVLAKAKELGIATAKVPSSSLDKITAEYLEEQLAPLAKAKHPEPATPAVPPPVPIPPPQPAPPVIEPMAPIVGAAETKAESVAEPPPLPAEAPVAPAEPVPEPAMPPEAVAPPI